MFLSLILLLPPSQTISSYLHSSLLLLLHCLTPSLSFFFSSLANTPTLLSLSLSLSSVPLFSLKTFPFLSLVSFLSHPPALPLSFVSYYYYYYSFLSSLLPPSLWFPFGHTAKPTLLFFSSLPLSLPPSSPLSFPLVHGHTANSTLLFSFLPLTSFPLVSPFSNHSTVTLRAAGLTADTVAEWTRPADETRQHTRQ